MSKDRFVALIKTVLYCQVLRGFLVTYTWFKVAAHSKQSFVSKTVFGGFVANIFRLSKKAIKYSSVWSSSAQQHSLFGLHVFVRTASNDSRRNRIIITVAVVVIILLFASSITFLWRMWKQGSSLREIQKGESFQLPFFLSFSLAHL
jgi:hypothetical protein